MKYAIYTVLALSLLALVGAGGADEADRAWRNDCDKQGWHASGGKVYECRVRK